MDPNETLKMLRAMVLKALEYESKAGGAPNDLGEMANTAIDIAEAFQNLDLWLLSGGSYPREWEDARRTPDRAATRKLALNLMKKG